MASTTCRSCDAPIRWARNVVTNKGLPLDPDPVENGNLVLVDMGSDSEELTVRYVKRGEDVGNAQRYQTHFVSCPDADNWRRS